MTTAAKIDARRAGRESAQEWRDAWRNVPTGTLRARLDKEPPVGEQFAILRELRERGEPLP